MVEAVDLIADVVAEATGTLVAPCEEDGAPWGELRRADDVDSADSVGVPDVAASALRSVRVAGRSKAWRTCDVPSSSSLLLSVASSSSS